MVREEHLTHTSTVYYLEGEVDTQQDKSEGKARSSLCMCEANVSSRDQAQLTGDRNVSKTQRICLANYNYDYCCLHSHPPASDWPRSRTVLLLQPPFAVAPGDVCCVSEFRER